MKTIIEPFKIKMVEPLNFTTPEERKRILKEAHHNLFMIRAEHVLIDLLTDSGTAAMSTRQWAAMMEGDESYAGARSWYRFEAVVKELTGFKHILPTHQGRAAERILFTIVCKGGGKVIPNNTHFDTTRANIEFQDAKALDIVIDEGRVPSIQHPFKGNVDIDKLRAVIEEYGPENIPMVMVTITNNSGGGQPVSLENIKAVRAVADEFGLPLYLDACRFAENAYFIKLREEGQSERTVKDICKEVFSLADGCTMSAKKDAMVNMGGFLATNDDELAAECRNLLILTEGFPTYGGLSGRDLEAMAVGLEEITEETYLRYRIASMEYLARALRVEGIQIVEPPGGHAIYLDARAFLPHLPLDRFPGQALACALYEHGGIRGVEIGSVMFGKKDEEGNEIPSEMDLVRLTLPRRVYTQSHVDYLAEVIAQVYHDREKVPGMRIVYEPPFLRHFTAHFEPIG